MDLLQYLGMGIVVVFSILLGFWSGRKVRSSDAFVSNRGNAGTAMIVGGVTGSFIGGSATIGTAQLAFTNGFSAIWFTLGGTIALILLAFIFAVPLRNCGEDTIPQLITRVYGRRTGVTTALLNSAGNFLGIVAQTISGTALLMAITSFGRVPATVILSVIVLLYMVFGGVLSAGTVGYAKVILLCAAAVVWVVFLHIHYESLFEYTQMPEVLPRSQYFSLFSRGFVKDMGAGFSVVLGVMSTQAYMQSVISGKTLRTTQRSLLISGAIMVAVGVICVYVGMFMHVHYPETPSQMVLPFFILQQMPSLAGGIMIGLLLMSVVGSCAGLTLGISSLMFNNLIRPALKKRGKPTDSVWPTRLVLMIVLALAGLVAAGNFGQLILGWSFLSMALRGTVIFIPMCAALFLPGKIDSGFALAAAILGPVSVVVINLLALKNVDGIFVGVLASFAVMAAGALHHRYTERRRT